LTWGNRLLSPTGRRNRLSEKIGSVVRTVDYDYDALNRLSREATGSSALTYDAGAGYETSGYDKVGNRHRRTVTGNAFGGTTEQSSLGYDANDRMDNDSDSATASTLFDANGNQTSDNGWTYEYDFENRLLTANNGSGTLAFTYDGDGNRIKKLKGTTSTYYLVDDLNPTGYAQVLRI
jgi:YD repeat-containing protein